MSETLDYADKIAKLLRKAEGTNNAAEAEIFTAKAIELMQRYSISEAMIDATTGRAHSDKIISAEILIGGQYSIPWITMTHGIAKAFDCRPITSNYWTPNGNTNRKMVVVVGFERDVAQVRLLTTSLIIQAGSAVKAYIGERREDDVAFAPNPARLLKIKQSFVRGFGLAAVKVLIESRKKVVEESTSSVALVLMDRSSEVDREFANMFPHVRSRIQRHSYIADAQAAGGIAGARADIGRDAFGRSKKELVR